MRESPRCGTVSTHTESGDRPSPCRLLTLLAEAHGEAGPVDDALVLLAQARALVESTGELRFEAEVHRLEGEVRRRRDEPEVAGGCFRRAIEIAHKQGPAGGSCVRT